MSFADDPSDMRRPRILVLGGTTDARALAGLLAARADLDPLVSLAGRTANPAALPVPVRTGGFGGAEGLAAYLDRNRIDFLVDATHPFALRISANAARAATMTGVPFVVLRRPGWSVQPGDRWTRVAGFSDAVEALGHAPRRVLLAVGRQEAHHFEAAPQHHYLVRSIDPVMPALNLPDAVAILAVGPFVEAEERALLLNHRIDVIVAKNSGGTATYGKIAAARSLGIEVVMIDRQDQPDCVIVEDAEAAMAMIDHCLTSAMKRGV